ncbi:retrovirus-related pol polyprotein from transposon TNT 1-94 [Tanacetum coccineum]
MADAEKTATLKTGVYKKAHSALLLCLDNKVLRKVNKENSAVGVWLKLETLYEFNKLISDLANIGVDIDDEDQAFMLLTSLPSSYDNFGEKLLYGRESLTLEDFLVIKDVVVHDQSQKNKKKSIGFVKKNAGQDSGMHSKGYDNGDLLMAFCSVIIEHVPSRGQGRHSRSRGIYREVAEWKSKGHISEVGFHKLERREVLGNKGLGGFGFTFLYTRMEASASVKKWSVLGGNRQNGLAEQMNRTLLNKVRCLLIQSSLPDSFWAEATVTTSYLINRSLSTTLEKKTPYEMLRIFGCVAYLLVNKGKLKPRAIKCIYLGDVVFNESLMYKDTLKGVGAADFGKEVEFEVLGMNGYMSLSRPLGSKEEDDITDEWVYAMKEEMSSLKKNHTCELVNQPPGQKLVSCEWLYKIKEGIKGIQKPRLRFGQAMGSAATTMIVVFTSRSLHKFDMKELGPTRKILGMNIVRDRGSRNLKVSQSGYKQKILNNYEVDNGKSIYVPLRAHFKVSLKDCPSSDWDVERMSKVPYAKDVGSVFIPFEIRSIRRIGCCQYGVLEFCWSGDHDKYLPKQWIRRISSSGYGVLVFISSWLLVKFRRRYAVSSLMDTAYWLSEQHILDFFGAADVGLVYGKDRGKHVDVDGFVDADYNKDPDKDRSIIGYMFMIHDCVVSWKATLQHVVALSTTEAEYMALTEAVKKSIWLKGVLIKLGINLREIVESKEIEVAKIGTKDNAADAFTKVVPGLKFNYCMKILGVGVN